MRRFKLLVCAVWATGICTTGAMAQAPDDYDDIGINVEDGRIVTKAMSEPSPGGVLFENSRVFGGEFFDQGGATFTDEPGMFAQDGTFAGGSMLSVHIRRALREWNGADFGMISTQRVRLELGATGVLSPETDALVPGLSFVVPARGGFDQHVDAYLLDGTLGASTLAGVFLLEVEYQNSSLLGGPSLPNYIVLSNNASAAGIAAATEYVRMVVVPIPATGVLLIFGGVCASRRRRR